MDKPNLSLIHGSGNREHLIDLLLRELLFNDEPDLEVIERLKEQLNHPQPELHLVKN
jgi:hypothetical protein